MRVALIDTNVYSAFRVNDLRAVQALRRPASILLSMTVLGEILSGFKCGSRERKNREELDEFLDSPRVRVVLTDETTAEYYSQIYRALRSKGCPIPTNDIWIAASALQHNAAVYTFDTHFSCIDSLLVEKL